MEQLLKLSIGDDIEIEPPRLPPRTIQPKVRLAWIKEQLRDHSIFGWKASSFNELDKKVRRTLGIIMKSHMKISRKREITDLGFADLEDGEERAERGSPVCDGPAMTPPRQILRYHNSSRMNFVAAGCSEQLLRHENYIFMNKLFSLRE
ncbi:MAG: hypothetical protein V4587_12080 [Acidobacteriota bacterium]